MAMVFKSRHFKRTLLVIAIIGGMWYLYVTKNNSNNNNNNNNNGRTIELRREDTHPLSLQERMQEVLAAREWLAENSVRMGYNDLGGGGEDPYSPNRLFNNAPPRTYYGAPSPSDVRFGPGSAWGNLPYRGPFAGGSGDLENYKHGAHAPSYPDAGQNGGQALPGQPYGKLSQYGDRDSIAQAWGNQVPNWNRNADSGRSYDSYQEPSFRNGPPKQYPAWGNKVYQNQVYNIPQKNRETNVVRNENSKFEDANNQQKYPSYSHANTGPQQNGNQQSDQDLKAAQKPGQAQNPSLSDLRQNENSIPRFGNTEEQLESKANSELSARTGQLPNAKPQMKNPTNPADILHEDKPAEKPPSPRESLENPPKPAEKPPQPEKTLLPGGKPPESVRSSGSQTNENAEKKPSLGIDSIQSSASKVVRSNSDGAHGKPPPIIPNSPPPHENSPLKSGPAILPSGSNNVMSPGRLPLSNSPLSARRNKMQKPTPVATTTESQNFVKRFLARLLYSDDDKDDNKDDDKMSSTHLEDDDDDSFQERLPVFGENRNSMDTLDKGTGERNGQQTLEERQRRVREESGLGNLGGGGGGGVGRGIGREGGGIGGREGGGIGGGIGGGERQNPPPLPDPSHHLRPRPEESHTQPPSKTSSLRFLPDFFRSGSQRNTQPFTGSRDQTSSQRQERGENDKDRRRHQEEKGAEKEEKGGPNGQADKNKTPDASSNDLTKVTMVTRDKTHWKDEPCLDQGPLPKATLTTPFGNVPLYLERDVNDTEAYNNAFGVQWNLHGVGTFFDRCLLPDPNVTLVDIGAGVGPVVFTAALLGREVFAIEPIGEMVGAMCRSVTDLGYGKVHVIHNAVSDERNKVWFRRGNKNHPTDSYSIDTRNKSKMDPNSPTAFSIRLDDILRLYKITSAAVRLNVESFEGRALAGANKFLNTVNIPCILMEWKYVHALKDFGGSYVFDVLSNHGFFPHDVNTLRPLKVFRMHDWPAEVLWAKLGSYPVKL